MAIEASRHFHWTHRARTVRSARFPETHLIGVGVFRRLLNLADVALADLNQPKVSGLRQFRFSQSGCHGSLQLRKLRGGSSLQLSSHRRIATRSLPFSTGHNFRNWSGHNFRNSHQGNGLTSK